MILAFIFSSLRLSTPLIFAALGGYFSERAGIINIALEGLMLIGAFSAAVVAGQTHSVTYGILGGICGSLLFAMNHGLLCIEWKSDPIISGLAVNLLSAGIPPVVCKALYDMSNSTPSLANAERVSAVFGVSPFVLGAALCSVLVWIIHTRTKFGQYLRFAGTHPLALHSQGVSVRKVQWKGVLLSGILCGLGGTYLSIDHSGGFTRNMTVGRGFIALAALIVGRWSPIPATLAAIAFGMIEASQMLLQGGFMPVQWVQMIPYAATLFILAGFFKRV